MVEEERHTQTPCDGSLSRSCGEEARPNRGVRALSFVATGCSREPACPTAGRPRTGLSPKRCEGGHPPSDHRLWMPLTSPDARVSGRTVDGMAGQVCSRQPARSCRLPAYDCCDSDEPAN